MLQDYIHYNIGAGIGKLTDTFFLKQRLEYEYNPKIDITNNAVHASPLRGEAGRSPDEGGYRYHSCYLVQRVLPLTRISKFRKAQLEILPSPTRGEEEDKVPP